jgi:hypothetical protein
LRRAAPPTQWRRTGFRVGAAGGEPPPVAYEVPAASRLARDE